VGSDLRHLGLLTVGQSPREDVTPTLRAILGESVHLRESGALDGLTEAGITGLSPRNGETPLETRLSDRAPVLVAEERLVPLLRQAADRLEVTCDRTLLLCSGEFPALAESHPAVVQPVHLLRGMVRAFCADRVLGIVGPSSDMDAAPQRWGAYARTVVTSAASPYGGEVGVRAAAAAVVELGAQLVFLNDMAFTGEHRATATAAGVPVLCATIAAGLLIGEVV